jgi:hypothetical protein
MTDLTDHIKHEESNDLPALEKQLKQEESQSMAASFERTKQFVPTRYHFVFYMLTIGLILVRRINHLLRLLWGCWPLQWTSCVIYLLGSRMKSLDPCRKFSLVN